MTIVNTSKLNLREIRQFSSKEQLLTC